MASLFGERAASGDGTVGSQIPHHRITVLVKRGHWIIMMQEQQLFKIPTTWHEGLPRFQKEILPSRAKEDVPKGIDDPYGRTSAISLPFFAECFNTESNQGLFGTLNETAKRDPGKWSGGPRDP